MKNMGLERILHKLSNKDFPPLFLSTEQRKELFEELKEIGEVFERIQPFSNSSPSGIKLLHLQFVIIKSVKIHIESKYGIQYELKYPDDEMQKYFKSIKPLSIEDLLERCKKILKKSPVLK